jgi:hypothetical protein
MLDCEQRGSIQSTAFDRLTGIEFRNNSKSTRSVYWIDYEGREVRYQTLRRGERGSQSTYVSHPWLVTDQSGGCVCIYLPDGRANPAVLTISDRHCSLNTDVEKPGYESTASYRRTQIQGWPVLISARYRKQDRTLKRVLNELESELREVKAVLPPRALQQIQDVKIWLEVSDARFPGGVYHPSASWLQQNGMNPDKANGAQFTGNLATWSREQPFMVLHELAHAYYYSVLGDGYAPVSSAYHSAIAKGLYAKVRHVDGNSREAYAKRDEKEYFAENSEAYFGKNDFYPFDRQDLKSYDPNGTRTIADAWRR